MRLYSGASTTFIEDATRNVISEKLRQAFFDYYRYMPSPGEIQSWNNSLLRISTVLEKSKLTDHGVMLEY